MRFQSHRGLSAGGHYACTQADNNGGEETTWGEIILLLVGLQL